MMLAHLPAMRLEPWSGLIHDHDRSKFALVQDSSLLPSDEPTLELSILQKADFWVQGQIVPGILKRTQGLAGQRHAERISHVRRTRGVPQEWRDFSPLVFAGTVWEQVGSGSLLVPCLNYFDDMSSVWELVFRGISDPSFYSSKARLVSIVQN